jgi:hypothetical protein
METDMSDYTNEANYKEFVAVYTEQLERVYGNDAGYMAMLARMPEGRNTIEGLAIRMTAGLLSGAANKDGDAIKGTCKQLKIKQTYKAIREYLTGTFASK